MDDRSKIRRRHEMAGAAIRPEGIRAVVPYLIVRDAARAITFLEAAFGAVEVRRLDAGQGKVGHAELRIGGGTVFLADEFPDFENIVGPESLEGTSVIIDLEVVDLDGVYERAIAAGARSIRAPDPKETGVRAAKVIDPFGHVWLITAAADN
jgi:PhnB protein